MIIALITLATSLFAAPENLPAGIYVGRQEEGSLELSLSVPAQGPIVLVTSHTPPDEGWFAFAEYEGRVQSKRDGVWTVVWARKKNSGKNFPLPASTSIKAVGADLVMMLPGLEVKVKRKSEQELVFAEMYMDPPYADKDLLFASSDRKSFFLVKRMPQGRVQFFRFTRAAPALEPMTASGWIIRLTRFLSAESAPRAGTGPVIDLKGKTSVRIQIDGVRTPASDAMLSTLSPLLEHTGQELIRVWRRKGSQDVIESYGEYRLWKTAANPEGKWYYAASGDDNVELWSGIGGGTAKFEWKEQNEKFSGRLIVAGQEPLEFEETGVQ